MAFPDSKAKDAALSAKTEKFNRRTAAQTGSMIFETAVESNARRLNMKSKFHGLLMTVFVTVLLATGQAYAAGDTIKIGMIGSDDRHVRRYRACT